MIQQKQIIQTVLKHYPEVQAIYFSELTGPMINGQITISTLPFY